MTQSDSRSTHRSNQPPIKQSCNHEPQAQPVWSLQPRPGDESNERRVTAACLRVPTPPASPRCDCDGRVQVYTQRQLRQRERMVDAVEAG
jgi:hypothetical protein